MEIIKGGQGKDSQEVQDSGFWFGVSLSLTFVLLVLAFIILVSQ